CCQGCRRARPARCGPQGRSGQGGPSRPRARDDQPLRRRGAGSRFAWARRRRGVPPPSRLRQSGTRTHAYGTRGRPRSRRRSRRRRRRLSRQAVRSRRAARAYPSPRASRRRLRHEGTVSFRLRVTLLTAAAVAIAAIGASVAMYFVVQDQLMHQIESNLVVAAQNAARGGGPGPGDGRRGFGPQSQFMTGRPDMYAQIITASGTIYRTDFDTPNTGLVVQEVKDVASGKRAAFFATADAQDTRLAMWVVPIQGGGAIEVVQDLALTGSDHALAQTRLLLIAFAAGAILLAAAL